MEHNVNHVRSNRTDWRNGYVTSKYLKFVKTKKSWKSDESIKPTNNVTKFQLISAGVTEIELKLVEKLNITQIYATLEGTNEKKAI